MHALTLFRIGLKYAFAFNANAVQSGFVGQFFISFAYRYLIEGAPIHSSPSQIVELAASAILIAHHTSVIFYTEGGEFREVLWAHPKLRPAGNDIPMQCSECGALQNFGVKTLQDRRKHAITAFYPTQVKCLTPDCKKSFEFPWGKEWTKPVEVGEGGMWAVRKLS